MSGFAVLGQPPNLCEQDGVKMQSVGLTRQFIVIGLFFFFHEKFLKKEEICPILTDYVLGGVNDLA